MNYDQTLNLDGGGTIQVSTDVEGSAAIGGDSASPDAGSIFIGSGKTGNWFTVEATGGAGAAAIGGGWNNQGGGSVNQIEIFAGAVTVNGGFKGMGLGVGYQGNGGLIEIWNGYVEAYGGESGAGISVGAGDEYGSCISIFGGRIEAHGGDYGAGIGGYVVECSRMPCIAEITVIKESGSCHKLF